MLSPWEEAQLLHWGSLWVCQNQRQKNSLTAVLAVAFQAGTRAGPSPCSRGAPGEAPARTRGSPPGLAVPARGLPVVPLQRLVVPTRWRRSTAHSPPQRPPIGWERPGNALATGPAPPPRIPLPPVACVSLRISACAPSAHPGLCRFPFSTLPSVCPEGQQW